MTDDERKQRERTIRNAVFERELDREAAFDELAQAMSSGSVWRWEPFGWAGGRIQARTIAPAGEVSVRLRALTGDERWEWTFLGNELVGGEPVRGTSKTAADAMRDGLWAAYEAAQVPRTRMVRAW